MIGAYYGTIPEGETRSLVYLQNELAKERTNDSTFSRLIWMPKGLKLKEDEVQQQKFIEMLRTDTEAQKGADLLEMSLEDLKRNIEDKLNTASRKPVEDAGSQDRPKQIYLICTREDKETAKNLRKQLFGQGFEVNLPVFEGEETAIFEEHKASLVHCDAVIIFYGNAGEPWVRSKMRELQKVMGYGRKNPLLVKAVFCAAPETSEKKDFMSHEVKVFTHFQEFSSEALTPFLEQFKNVMEGGQK